MRIAGTFGMLPMPPGSKRILKGGIFLIVETCLLVSILQFLRPDYSPTHWSSLLIQAALLGTVVLVIVVMGYPLWLSKNLQVELIKEGILVHASPFGRPGKIFAWSSIRSSEARLTCLTEDSRLTPLYNLSCLGPTRLRNGEKALVYVWNGTVPFVYVPACEGPSLLLQVASPEEFLEMLVKLAEKQKV